jgi:hypothetical protein
MFCGHTILFQKFIYGRKLKSQIEIIKPGHQQYISRLPKKLQEKGKKIKETKTSNMYQSVIV